MLRWSTLEGSPDGFTGNGRTARVSPPLLDLLLDKVEGRLRRVDLLGPRRDRIAAGGVASVAGGQGGMLDHRPDQGLGRHGHQGGPGDGHAEGGGDGGLHVLEAGRDLLHDGVSELGLDAGAGADDAGDLHGAGAVAGGELIS